jgi:hypothetical protein
MPRELSAPLPEAVTQYLANTLRARREWDEPPHMTLLSGPGPITSHSVPLPWDAVDNPRDLLADLAQVMSSRSHAWHPLARAVRDHTPAGCNGIALRHEAWMATGSAAALPGPIAGRPDAVETRVMTAVTLGGRGCMALQRRDQPHRIILLQDETAPGGRVGGDFPEHLTLILAALEDHTA